MNASTIPCQLSEIQRVEFFKRDEVTTDLICCEISDVNKTWFFHEELANWDQLISELEALPSFRSDWISQVSQPVFASSLFVAFNRLAL